VKLGLKTGEKAYVRFGIDEIVMGELRRGIKMRMRMRIAKLFFFSVPFVSLFVFGHLSLKATPVAKQASNKPALSSAGREQKGRRGEENYCSEKAIKE